MKRQYRFLSIERDGIFVARQCRFTSVGFMLPEIACHMYTWSPRLFGRGSIKIYRAKRDSQISWKCVLHLIQLSRSTFADYRFANSSEQGPLFFAEDSAEPRIPPVRFYRSILDSFRGKAWKLIFRSSQTRTLEMKHLRFRVISKRASRRQMFHLPITFHGAK